MSVVRNDAGSSRIDQLLPLRHRTAHHASAFPPSPLTVTRSDGVELAIVVTATVGALGFALSSHGVAGTSAGAAYTPPVSNDARLSRLSRSDVVL